VADILKEDMIGVKGDTGEEIIARFNAVDFPSRQCSQKDLPYLIWTSGTWLMKNASFNLILYFYNIITVT
jgi:hypothetical protein